MEQGGNSERQAKSESAAHNHRQENRHDGTPEVGFVRPRQPNAVDHDRPNSGNGRAANRNHLQHAGCTLGKGQNAKSGFERLARAAYDHQTKVHDGCANKKSDDHKDRNEDQKGGSADAEHGK
ncbi:MAG TPA: hypothetical protein VGH65_06345, partial [Verrucomicrobiaceae bacterium]